MVFQQQTQWWAAFGEHSRTFEDDLTVTISASVASGISERRFIGARREVICDRVLWHKVTLLLRTSDAVVRLVKLQVENSCWDTGLVTRAQRLGKTIMWSL